MGAGDYLAISAFVRNATLIIKYKPISSASKSNIHLLGLNIALGNVGTYTDELHGDIILDYTRIIIKITLSRSISPIFFDILVRLSPLPLSVLCHVP